MTTSTVAMTTNCSFTFTSSQTNFEPKLLSILTEIIAWLWLLTLVTVIVEFIQANYSKRAKTNKQKIEFFKSKSINHYCNSAPTPTQFYYPAGFLQASVQLKQHLAFILSICFKLLHYNRHFYLSTFVLVWFAVLRHECDKTENVCCCEPKREKQDKKKNKLPGAY